MFLGLTGFYSKFIENYAELALPLFRLLKEKETFKWEAAEIDSFNKLKSAIKNFTLLNFYDPNEGILKLKCDATNETIAAVLEQKKKDGYFYPIFFISKKLNERERNFPIGEKEAFSIVYGIEKFRNYFLGKKFVVEADHISLLTLLKEGKGKISTTRLIRWKSRLSIFDFEIILKKEVKTLRRTLCLDFLKTLKTKLLS